DDASLRRLLASVAEVHVAGRAIDLGTHLGDQDPKRVDLPTYAFQRKRFWMSPALDAVAAVAAARRDPGGIEHPVLTTVPGHPENEGLQFTGRLSLAAHSWLADHAVNEVVLLPGAALAELALFAGEQVGCPSVTELVLHEPLVIPEHDTVLIQVVVSDEPADGRGVRIYSRRQSPEPLDTRPVWTKHAEAVLRSDPAGGSASPTASPAASPTVHPMISPTTYPTADLTTNLTTDPAVWPPLDAVPVDVSDCYGRLARRGYQYGPAFRGLRAAWRRGAELYAEVALPEAAGGDDFGLHPALLDAALHALEYLDPGREATSEQVRLPFAWA